jgi:hypothetical protein
MLKSVLLMEEGVTMSNRYFLSAALCGLTVSACLAQAPTSPAERKLIDLITREQRNNVKKSTGTNDYQCFTDINLASFKSSNRPQKIVETLKSDSAFKTLVEEFRGMSESARKEAFSHARKICQPTWGEMGYIDKEGNGQTDAGQQAQLLISAAIVDAIQNMIK